MNEIDGGVYSALLNLYNVVNTDRSAYRETPKIRRALAEVFASFCRANEQEVVICPESHVYAPAHLEACPYCE